MTITWKNINRPNFSGVSAGAANATNTILDGADRVTRTVQGLADQQSARERKESAASANDIVRQIQEANKAGQSLGDDFAAQSGLDNLKLEDRDRVLSAMGNQDTAIFDYQKQQDTRNDYKTERAEKPVADKVSALIAQGNYDEATSVANSSEALTGQTKAQLLSQVEKTRNERFLTNDKLQKVRDRQSNEKLFNDQTNQPVRAQKHNTNLLNTVNNSDYGDSFEFGSDGKLRLKPDAQDALPKEEQKAALDWAATKEKELGGYQKPKSTGEIVKSLAQNYRGDPTKKDQFVQTGKDQIGLENQLRNISPAGMDLGGEYKQAVDSVRAPYDTEIALEKNTLDILNARKEHMNKLTYPERIEGANDILDWITQNTESSVFAVSDFGGSDLAEIVMEDYIGNPEYQNTDPKLILASLKAALETDDEEVDISQFKDNFGRLIEGYPKVSDSEIKAKQQEITALQKKRDNELPGKIQKLNYDYRKRYGLPYDRTAYKAEDMAKKVKESQNKGKSEKVEPRIKLEAFGFPVDSNAVATNNFPRN